ncbi:MAG: excinuclease ABC subunit UvrC [Myxococcota bacterium]
MDLVEQAAALPTTAGVYVFKDKSGDVLYVGKAVNLRARVKQYLQGHDERYMVRYLVAAARSVEVFPVPSEKEALILENQLIKQHQPRFNTKLRDDKNFLHIRIDPRAKWPRFTLVRRIKDDGARYFGPYASATNARRTLAFVGKSFPLRTCTDRVLATRKRPCLLYQMRRCVGPCVDLCTSAEYAEVLQDALLFLSGKDRELVGRLQDRMLAAAEAEKFEEATRYRDLITTLRSSLDRQSVVDVRLGDRDVWALYREGDRGAVALLPVRGGHMQQPLVFPFEGEIVEDGELLSALLNDWYEIDVPPEVLLPVDPPDHVALQDVLSERRGSKVTLAVPKRGEKVRVIEIAEQAAKARFHTTHSADERLAHALEQLAEIAGLDVPPYRIECYDNSNLLGQDPVASQVVFLEGKPARAEYRRYKVKTVIGADDFATMREILGRRLRRASEEGNFPDLIVVDGGRGQLNAAEAVLRELGLEDQAVIGLSKPRTERKRGDRDAVDKIILRDNPDPIVLPETHPTLRMLQHIRDEAHRTAIGFHRKTRSKSHLKSALDDLPGLGPTRRQALLTHFGSLKAVREAAPDRIAEVPGFGPALAKRVWEALQKGVAEG